MEKENKTPCALTHEEIALIKRIAWNAAKKFNRISHSNYYREETHELAAHAICHVISHLRDIPKPLLNNGAYIYKMAYYSIIHKVTRRRRPVNFTSCEVSEEEKIFTIYDKEELKREVQATLKATLAKFKGQEKRILRELFIENKKATQVAKELNLKKESFAWLIARFKRTFKEEWRKG